MPYIRQWYQQSAGSGLGIRKYSLNGLRSETFETKAAWLGFKKKFAEDEKVLAKLVNLMKKTKSRLINKALVDYRGLVARSYARYILSTRRDLTLLPIPKTKIEYVLWYIKRRELEDVARMFSMTYDQAVSFRNYLVLWKAQYDRT